jgi:hypothetical protein
MHVDLETLAEFGTIEEAQRHIDQWIIRQAEYDAAQIVKKQKKKTKKITYVDYP